MIGKKSRYARARAFEAATNGTAPFSGIRPREIGSATGVIEHEVQADDRLDQLARHYYNNDRMWWRIIDANPEFFFGQSYLPPRGPEDVGGSEPPVHAPGVVLCKEMEGSVILIPKQSEG